MQKINNIASFTGILFTMAIFWQTNLSAQTITEHSMANTENRVEKTQLTGLSEVVIEATVKSIQIEVVKLTDNSGLTYIGGKVNAADLDVYLFQMKQILGDDFTLYRQYQSKRDHQTFHITLINPYEYQTLAKGVTIGARLSVSLRGLARVSADDKTAYFVVAQSSQAKNYRQSLVLTDKDFHITLGFYPNDVYGVSKGLETLIK